ncbi:SGNH/GDSL hydrolase family protein [Flavobacterium sp. ZS1P70]|uniref:SGNH/GDSL hydrolase family protein n=1 Tax=Flavobacterium zhoui TaxID=3230414 RepID=A0ABW6I6T6_9FLAO
MLLNKIYCIGDSHVSVFLGKDAISPIYPEKCNSLFSYFDVTRIGSITAFNIGNPKSSTQAKVKIDSLISNVIPKGSVIIFSAGEIDIRVHLLKQVEAQKESIQKITFQIIQNYLFLLRQYSERGYIIVVLSPPPSAFKVEDDPSYPRYGSEQNRNIATKIFNDILKCEAEKKGIGYLDIYTNYVDSNNFTKRKYLWDGIHPSTAVIIDIIFQLNSKLNTNLTISFCWNVREFLRKIKAFLN